MENGNYGIEGLRIFKAGTFKDSLGIERTWTSIHLDQMVLHFNYLAGNDIFPNVPVRKDHSYSVEDVVGWITKVYKDPDDDIFLCCDMELVDAEAYEAWEGGKYRNRSLEVGEYETNDGEVYWPTIMGVAFVDIPAVEGLHSRGTSDAFFTEAHVKEDKTPMDHDTFMRACAYAAWVDAANYAKALDDWSRAATYAAALDQWANAANFAQGLSDAGLLDAFTASQTQADHGRNGNHSFRVNGTHTNDFSAVQRHIDALEATQKEARASYRTGYVESLVTDGKITPAMKDNFTKLVLGMTDDAFKDFSAGYDAAPKLSIFENHGGGNGDPGQGAGQSDPSEDLVILQEIVDNLSVSMDHDKLVKTSAYQKLQAAKAKSD